MSVVSLDEGEGLGVNGTGYYPVDKALHRDSGQQLSFKNSGLHCCQLHIIWEI